MQIRLRQSLNADDKSWDCGVLERILIIFIYPQDRDMIMHDSSPRVKDRIILKNNPEPKKMAGPVRFSTILIKRTRTTMHKIWVVRPPNEG